MMCCKTVEILSNDNVNNTQELTEEIKILLQEVNEETQSLLQEVSLKPESSDNIASLTTSLSEQDNSLKDDEMSALIIVNDINVDVTV